MSKSSSPIKKRSREEDSPSDKSDPNYNGTSSKRKGGNEDKEDNEEDDATERREDAHMSAKSALNTAVTQLPYQAGAIKVLDFGTLKPSSSAFHSPVSLFPVGYKCEVIVDHRESPFRRDGKETVLCEVLEVDNQPEFVLTVQSSGRVFIASSEDRVWKKFEEKHSVDTYLSFFNLAIELLLEGLPGAPDCQEYLFHCQRGYGTDYFTDEQAVLASTLFMPRQSRDSRSRHRQSARSLSVSDSKVLNEVRKKQKAIEDERKKAQLRKEKEAKEQEREAREAQREQERALKERERALQAERREARKEADRLAREQDRLVKREQNRREGKPHGASAFSGHREKQADLRRARAEAAALVLQSFDEEEEQAQRDQVTLDILRARLDESESQGTSSNAMGGAGPKPSVKGAAATISVSLESFLSGMTSFQEELSVDGADVEHVLDAFNCLYSLRSFLGISADLTFNKFITDILGNPLAAPAWKGQEQQREEDGSGALVAEAGGGQQLLLEQAQDAAELDRVQLNILRVLLPDLHARFSLNEDAETVAPKKGSKEKDVVSTSAGKTSFPLNQLTWPELARMLLLEFVDIEMEKSEEEIVHTLRGSKASGFKSAKNIVKSLRCRLATRHLASTFHREAEFAARLRGPRTVPQDRDDKLLQVRLAAPPVSQSQELASSSRKASESLFDFTSEAEVVSAVSEAALGQLQSPVAGVAVVAEDSISSSSSGNGSLEVAGTKEESCGDAEEYRRCCKVWLKIMAMSQAKGLLWEVDENVYPGYFAHMQRPLTLVTVAYRLLQKSYSSSPGSDQGEASSVSSCFYRDMRQVLVNCISYNSEANALFGHAQKLLQVLHRHMQQWVFSPARPAQVAQCDDAFCMHSHLPIAAGRERGEYTSVKCGRCAGVFSLGSLQQLEHQQEFGVFQPTQEEVVQSHEDWICHLCLREDGVAAAASSEDVAASDSCFSIDEWGPSARLPWHLNTLHALQLHQFTEDMPSLPDIVEAVKIITAPNLTPMLPIGDSLVTIGDMQRGHKTLLPWTMRERLKVYAALCELLKSHEASHDFMTKLYKECTALTKMSVTDSFCEADFIEQVKRVAGAQGVALCRSLLDGVEADSEAVKQNKVVEGRCIHCRGSTFEDFIAEDDEVLLCDGCNAEAHLSCLTIDKVPAREWYCGPCAERIASRVEGDETTLDVDACRRLDLEAALQEESARLEREGLPYPRSECCAYCGGSELDLCSPLVFGQSREEFDECMKAFVSSLDLNASVPEQKVQVAPAMPFFPLFSEPKSEKMVLSGKKKAAVVVCPVVHELCALKMCKARMQRSRHSIRRKRKVIADRVADMAYISSRPIGHDDCGRFYWQFPNSNNSLFVSPPSLMAEREPDKAVLAEKMAAEKSGKKDKSRRGTPQKKAKGSPDRDCGVVPAALFSQASEEEERGVASGKWVRVTNIGDIARVIDLLGGSRSEAEVSLCHSLKTLYHTNIAASRDRGKGQEAMDKEEGAQSCVVSAVAAIEVPKEERKEQEHEGNEPKPEVDEDDKGSAEAKTSDEGANKSRFSEFSYKGGSDAGGEEDEQAEDDDGWDYGRRRPPRRAAAPIVPRAKPGEGVPVRMAILPSHGAEVQGEYVIKKECVFEDTAGDDGDEDGASDDGEDDQSYKKYFVFSRKYFAVALQDCYDATCKLGKRFTVNFQVHHEDDDTPVACTMLREPWDDGVYYFATLNFKKSGNYTISFLVEGAKATNIAPLVFPVKVVADQVIVGVECALDSLRAYNYITHGERHITHRRRELLTEVNRASNEFAAVKSALLTVYLGLPLGALAMGFADEDRLSKHDMAGAVVNATGWNAVVDQLWRESVLTATCSAALMECALLLEYYVHKNWLPLPHSRLLATLPSPHYAMRCPTLSAVALRVFCLDKALAYDRVQDLGRSSRATQDKKEQGGRGGRKEVVEKPRKSKSSQAAKRGLERVEATALADEAHGHYGDSIGSSRPRRAAMTRARENMSQSLRQEYEGFDDDEEFGGGRSRRARRGQAEHSSGPQEWTCPSCTYLNASRARSCDACSEKKPVEGGQPSLLRVSLAMSREERMRKRSGVHEEEDDEFDGESSSSSDEEDEGAGRKRKRGFYTEANDSEEGDEEEEEEEHKSKSKSKSKKKGKKGGAAGPSIGVAEEAYEHAVDLEALLAARRGQLVERAGGVESDLVLKMLTLLQELQDDPASDPFWEPVDEDYYSDYRDKVDEPMDLGSIARRVSVGFYAHPEEFAEDVRKVWTNCQAYNDDGSEIHTNSKRLGSFFEELLAQLRSPAPDKASAESLAAASGPPEGSAADVPPSVD